MLKSFHFHSLLNLFFRLPLTFKSLLHSLFIMIAVVASVNTSVIYEYHYMWYKRNTSVWCVVCCNRVNQAFLDRLEAQNKASATTPP